jgi:glycosyltransferase involved in cell wall biosynthesis
MTRPPLRVCQVITKLEIGGAQETVLVTAEQFRDDPDVELVTLAGPEDASGGVNWDRAARRDLDVRVVPELRRAVLPGLDVRALGALRRSIRELRPDVVHTHSSKAGVLGRIAATREGVTAVHTVHGWSTIRGDQSALVRTAVVALERRLAVRTAGLVVVTEGDRAIGLEEGIGRPDQYHLVRSPLDAGAAAEARAQRVASRQALGLGDAAFVVGSVGRLASPKDPGTLLAGFARFAEQAPDAVLVLLGTGPLAEDLRATAARLGIADRVRFAGEDPRAAVLVGAFDVSVLASRWEGLPRTVVEAAAAGVPIVANPVGGVSEVVEDGRSGLLFPVGDDAALARALARLHADVTERRRLAVAAAERVTDDFGVTTMGRRLAELWSTVAGRPVPGEVLGAP